MLSRQKSISSNSSDKENDYLEEEFLKLSTKDIPIPKPQIKMYEPEVQEVMKSGCNRQIAEYALLQYKEIEDKDNSLEKLSILRNEYNKVKKDIINNVRTDVENYVKEGKLDLDTKENNEFKIDGYENEIEEILESDKLNEMKKDNTKNLDNVEKYAKYYLEQHLKKEKNIEVFKEKRKKYYDKREAVIEACLRKIKKIVNDEEEYKKFYEEYFNSKEDKKEENIINNK